MAEERTVLRKTRVGTVVSDKNDKTIVVSVERAAHMESSLYRTGLLEDQHVRYALAYAYFSSNRFPQAHKHLEHLTEPELFRKGIELRRLMQMCKEEPWKCL